MASHLGGLRRAKSGAYTLEEAVKRDEVDPSKLLQGPGAVRGLPRIDVDEAARARLQQGQAVPWECDLEEGELGLAVHGEALLAVVKRERGSLRVSRGLWSG